MRTYTLLRALGVLIFFVQCDSNGGTVPPNTGSLRKLHDTKKVTGTYQVQCSKDHKEANGTYTVDNGSEVRVVAKLEGDEEAKKAVRIEWDTKGSSALCGSTITPSETTWSCTGKENTKIKLSAKAVYTDAWKDRDNKPEIVDEKASYEIHWVDLEKEKRIKAIQDIKEAFEAKKLMFELQKKNGIAFKDGCNLEPATVIFNNLTVTNQSERTLDLQYLKDSGLQLKAYIEGADDTESSTKDIHVVGPRTNTILHHGASQSLPCQSFQSVQNAQFNVSKNPLDECKCTIYWLIYLKGTAPSIDLSEAYCYGQETLCPDYCSGTIHLSESGTASELIPGIKKFDESLGSEE